VLEDRPRRCHALLQPSQASPRRVRRSGYWRSHNSPYRHGRVRSCPRAPGHPACIRRSDRTFRSSSLQERLFGPPHSLAGRRCGTQSPPTRTRAASGAFQGAPATAVFACSGGRPSHSVRQWTVPRTPARNNHGGRRKSQFSDRRRPVGQSGYVTSREVMRLILFRSAARVVRAGGTCTRCRCVNSTAPQLYRPHWGRAIAAPHDRCAGFPRSADTPCRSGPGYTAGDRYWRGRRGRFWWIQIPLALPI